MDIQEIHVGIDLGIQRLDSNIFGNIQKPEKDYYINIVIDELLRAVVLKESNTVFSLLTYSDINEYYEAVQAHILRASLSRVPNLAQGYVRCEFPSNVQEVEIITGNLIAGTYYEVVTAGDPTTIDLSGYGLTGTVAAGDKFKCVIADKTDEHDMILRIGGIYKILNPGNATFIPYGATSNDVGTVFTCNTDVTIPTISGHLQVIEESPIWVTGSKLLTTSTNTYYVYIKSDSYTEYGSSIAAGSIKAGSTYKVTAVGTTDFSAFGGYEVNVVGTVFTCTVSGIPTWVGDTIKEIKAVPNRLVKEQDVRNLLTNSFGTVITSPILVIRDYGLDVYTDGKFDIDDVILSYIKRPVRVSYEKNITTDLPESIHSKLVGLIVAYMAADLDPQTYAIKKDKVVTNDIN